MLLLTVASAASARTAAPFKSDNETLNNKIAEGKVTVRTYSEPSKSAKIKIDAKLMELGYSDEAIANTIWTKKDAWARSDRKPTVKLLSLDGEGWINWNFAVTDSSTSINNVYYLRSDWDWLVMPSFALTDKVGWAWHGTDDFVSSAATPSFNEWYAYGCTDTGVCMTKAFSSKAFEKSQPGAGAGVEMDIIGAFWEPDVYGDDQLYTVAESWGEAAMYVQRTRTKSGATRDFSATSQYFHQQFAPGASITFGPGVSLGLSCCSFNYTTSSAPSPLNHYVD